jgi:periplasmic divalent cation tolerance protein
MGKNGVVSGYITCENNNQALQIGKSLVQEHLAACANIIPQITSVYFWEEKLCEDKEALLLIKTIKDKTESIIRRVKELHSYRVPACVFYPACSGLKEYMDWIREKTIK